MSRPRPVEFAVAFDDGTAVTTLVNPQRDLADARKAFGINVSDVLLAPTLREAWAVVAPMMAGFTPVGVGVDETLGFDRLRAEEAGACDGDAAGRRAARRPGVGPDGVGAGAVGVGRPRWDGCRGGDVGVQGT